MVGAFSKPAVEDLAIEVEILALIESMLQARAFCLSNLQVEGDYAILISYMPKSQRVPWRYDGLLFQILDEIQDSGYPISWPPHSAANVTDL